MSGALLRVAVRVPAAKREEAIAILLGLAETGFEERDDGGETEFAVYTDGAGETRLRAAFDTVASVPVAAGWEDAWRAFHRPVTAGGLWIGPPWLEPPPAVPAVVIDPGRAFGTGGHPTTRLCVELLAGTTRGSLLDVGCGSGVLAIAAALLGFAPVTATDLDPVAVDVTRANAAVNGVVVDAHVLDATNESLPPCDVTVVNVSAEVVERVLRRLQSPLVITSGYLEDDDVAHDGWMRVGRSAVDGWAADIFGRENSV